MFLRGLSILWAFKEGDPGWDGEFGWKEGKLFAAMDIYGLLEGEQKEFMT